MKRLRHGQTILEVIIATTLISMAVIAALSLINQSQKSSTYSKLLDEATALNNQAADYLRNQKSYHGYATLADKITLDASTTHATYCLSSLPATPEEFLTLSPGTCGPTDYVANTIFRRDLTVATADLDSGIIRATITTNWEDSQTRTTFLDLELTQWN